MLEQNRLESLEARLKELDEERDAIEKLIAIWRGQPAHSKLSSTITATSYSVRGRVVDAIIELIHKMGKQVGNKEILEHLAERGISLGDTKNKEASLAAILSQEVKKKSARLRKVARGVYDIK